MDTLLDILEKILEVENNPNKQMQLEHTFIEKIAFSSFEEIYELLDVVDVEYWLEFPVWVRLLSYRLVCLLDPDNPSLKRRVAAGLLSFGPDWDLEAKKLQEDADKIENIGM